MKNEGEIEQRERVEDRESNEQEKTERLKKMEERVQVGKERDMENEC